MAITPPQKKEESAGRYSATDQQGVPDYGHSNHEQGEAGKGASKQEAKPWRGRPHQGEGKYGYRRDEGGSDNQVDGDIPRKPDPHHQQ